MHSFCFPQNASVCRRNSLTFYSSSASFPESKIPSFFLSFLSWSAFSSIQADHLPASWTHSPHFDHLSLFPLCPSDSFKPLNTITSVPLNIKTKQPTFTLQISAHHGLECPRKQFTLYTCTLFSMVPTQLTDYCLPPHGYSVVLPQPWETFTHISFLDVATAFSLSAHNPSLSEFSLTIFSLFISGTHPPPSLPTPGPIQISAYPLGHTFLLFLWLTP